MIGLFWQLLSTLVGRRSITLIWNVLPPLSPQGGGGGILRIIGGDVPPSSQFLILFQTKKTKRTPSIKRTLSRVPIEINVLYFPF